MVKMRLERMRGTLEAANIEADRQRREGCVCVRESLLGGARKDRSWPGQGTAPGFVAAQG